MKKVELLAPAGDLERLKVALLYGADAVYIGGPSLNLRANAINFTLEEIDTFKHFDFICDGDSKIITADLNWEEEE